MSGDTKERILDCAIDLFSIQGYDAVSVRNIAAAVGIKASSLYKHFENKESILEHIFDLFRSVMLSTHEYESKVLQLPDRISAAEILKNSFILFRDLIYQPRLLKITRIINLEQGRNASIKSFFRQELVDKPIYDLEATFAAMIASGLLKPVSPRKLATIYHANIISTYFIHNILKDNLNLPQVEKEMLDFIDFFCETFGKE
jgi:AcrR family transcriptional regulator